MADEDGRLVSLVISLNCCRVRATRVDGDLLRELLVTNRLAQEGLGSGPIAIGSQQKVNGVALCVHRAL
jgi:hypothetical protein